MTDVYTRTAQRIPFLTDQVHLPAGASTFAATDMLDVDWMAQRVADTGRRWGSVDPRVNGTLWWYSASSTLTGIPVATAMITGFAAQPRLADAFAYLRPDGYFGGLRGDTFLSMRDGVSHLAEELAGTLGDLIVPLSEASSVRPRALWAIVTDSVANRALDAGDASGDRLFGSAFAQRLVEEMRNFGAPMPTTRFVDVTAGRLSRRFTQRASCCLIYEARENKCTSCPKRLPSDRLADLRKIVS